MTSRLHAVKYLPYGDLIRSARGLWRAGPALKVLTYAPGPPPPLKRVRERTVDLLTYR